MSSVNDCLSTSTSSNRLSMDGIWIDGKDSAFDNIIEAYTAQIQDCIISTLLSTEMVSALQNLDTTTSNQDTTAGQSADLKAKTDSKISDTQKNSSFLDIIMNNLTIIIAIIGVVVVVGIALIGGPAILKMFSSKASPKGIAAHAAHGAVGSHGAVGAVGAPPVVPPVV